MLKRELVSGKGKTPVKHSFRSVKKNLKLRKFVSAYAPLLRNGLTPAVVEVLVLSALEECWWTSPETQDIRNRLGWLWTDVCLLVAKLQTRRLCFSRFGGAPRKREQLQALVVQGNYEEACKELATLGFCTLLEFYIKAKRGDEGKDELQSELLNILRSRGEFLEDTERRLSVEEEVCIA